MPTVAVHTARGYWSGSSAKKKSGAGGESAKEKSDAASAGKKGEQTNAESQKPALKKLKAADNWSKTEQDQARNALENLSIVSFFGTYPCGVSKGCGMKHVDGTFGYIKFSDAKQGRYPIYDYDTDELIYEFNRVSDLLEVGWKLST